MGASEISRQLGLPAVLSGPLGQPGGKVGPAAGPFEPSTPRFRSQCRVRSEPNDEPLRRPQVGRAFRPFDQEGAALPALLKPELIGLAPVAQAVEIAVADLEARQDVGLEQGEGWAGHGDGLTGARPDHRPRKLALARTQIAHEQDDVALGQVRGEPGTQRQGGVEIGQVERERRAVA
jgi:hypothetical protein